MARNKKVKRTMKKDSPDAKGNSPYAVKEARARKRHIFSANSPFNLNNRRTSSQDIEVTVNSIHIRSDSDGVIDRMIIDNRGVHHNGHLPSTKFEATERE